MITVCSYTNHTLSYERRIEDLQRELQQRGGGQIQAPTHGAPQLNGPSQAVPPVIGHGPRDLFGGIMAGAGGAQGPAVLGPPPQVPEQLQGMPAHLTSSAGAPNGPQPGQHPPFASYQPGVNGESRRY